MESVPSDTAISGGATKTPAQLMQEQHEAGADHHPIVEEEVDEEDIQHPPGKHAAPDEEDPLLVDAPTNGMMSAKAAGKQKATEKLGVLDPQDEEAFPSLGPAAKSPPKMAAPRSGWAAAASKAKPNGNTSNTSRPTSSGGRTPSSTPGVMTPSRTSAPSTLNLPGRSTDSFEIDNTDLNKEKSLSRVFQDVKKKYGVIVKAEQIDYGRRTLFTAEGPKARVTEVLMQISKELTVEKQVKLEIPSTVSAQIIGRAGQNIKKLEAQFNVRIKIDRNMKPAANSEDVGIDIVEIRGHAAQVRQVYEQISNQARTLQPKVDVPLRNIPPEFYPFLAHRHAPRMRTANDNLDVKIPSFHTWQQQPPPRAEANQHPVFAPHGDLHIVISGEQAAAQQARVELERFAKELEQELILEELAAEQILHPYIVGPRGMDPLEFMERTGCAVVLPPPHHETEDVHIIGPRDRLEHGRNLAEELMSKKHNRAVDLQKHYSDAPQGAERHSRALAQYLQKRAIEREFEDSHNAEIVFPMSSIASPSWNIIGNDPQKTMAARNDLSKITQAYPTSRLQLVEIDPFFHPHLEGLHAQPLQEMGVQMIVPANGEDPVVLVYEGPQSEATFSIPRTRPTKSEVNEFESALQEATQLLMASIPHEGISGANITVPRKHHDRVRKFVNEQPKPQAPKFPVQVDFGTQSHYREQKGSTDKVFLRGPQESDIAELQKAIESLLLQAEQDEKERGYNTTFDFNSKHIGKLVGKNGQRIQELKDKHDVEIETGEKGKVKVQGPQRMADACKSEILKLLKDWEDEATLVIKIDPKYHGMLVGRNGETLQKIQRKVNDEVRIDFPRTSKGRDDASDAASDVGGSRQANDEVRIRGPRAKAEKVRDELLDLRQYYEDNSHSASVTVAQAQLPSLIGKKGSEMEKLRQDTGAQIEVPSRDDNSSRVTIQLKGSKEAVEAARRELQKRGKAFDDIVTKELEVDTKHYSALIGQGGANIQEMVKAAGAPGTSAEHVKFPRKEQDSQILVLKGTEEVVQNLSDSITLFVAGRDKRKTETVQVPTHLHRTIIGQGGSNKRQMEKDYSCTISVPSQGSGQTSVKLTGDPDKVAALRTHLAGLSPPNDSAQTFMVPRSLHWGLARGGQMSNDLKRLGIRSDFDRSSVGPPPVPTSSRSLPLITDNAGEEGSGADGIGKAPFDFRLEWGDCDVQHEGEEEISWTLTPTRKDANMKRAKEKMDFYLDKTKNNKYHVGHLTLSDPKYNRYVVGQNGKLIKAIRNHRMVDIQVPKAGESGPIVLHGYGLEKDDGIEGLGNVVDQIIKEIKAQTANEGTTVDAWKEAGITPEVGSPPFGAQDVRELRQKIKELEL